MQIPKNPQAKILEIGSGHNPHPRSTILCDRFLYDNQERQRIAIRYDRPLCVAAGEKLPFADKSFDFILCSQILEHTQNPLAFCNEISRVGKAGLIIVPEIKRELLFGWPYHYWFFSVKNDELIHFPKDKSFTSPFGHFFHTHFQHSIPLRRFVEQHEKNFNLYVYWQNQVRIKKSEAPVDKVITMGYEELNELLKAMSYSFRADLDFFLSSIYKRLRKKWHKESRSLAWKLQTSMNRQYNLKVLLPMLRCIECYQPLVQEKQKLRCTSCKQRYSLAEDSVPVMLNPREKERGL